MVFARIKNLKGIRRLTLILCGMSMLGLSAQEGNISNVSDPILLQSPLVSQAYELLELGDSAGALVHFQQALTVNAENLSALLGQAMILADLGRHPEAYATYDKIVAKYPRHAFAWNGRGLAAFNMEDFDTAMSSFKQATTEQPINGFFYESLAWAQMCRGEFLGAAAAAKTATLMYNKKGESSAYPLLIAYFAYLEADDQRNAQASLNYALRNKPINVWPSPVIDYLAGSSTASELIGYVQNSAQETEAHTYIGLKLRAEGDENTAKKHLEWVARNGDNRVFEYTLARALKFQDSVVLLVP
jgi:tetratricopeptide (TPR) repeat protein